MIRLKILLIALLSTLIGVSARDLKITKFELDPMDLTAARYSRIDSKSASPCALVRVALPIENVKFEGEIEGEPRFDVNSYLVYMPISAKELTIKCPKYSTLKVNFAQESVSQLQSKTVYNLLVGDAEELAKQGEYVTFEVPEYLENKYLPLFIDGLYLSSMHVKNGRVTAYVPYGEHVYEVWERDTYGAASGSFTVNEGQKETIKLDIPKREGFLKVNLADKDKDAQVSYSSNYGEEYEFFTNINEKEKSSSITPSKIMVKVTKAGHETFLAPVEIVDQQTSEINVPELVDQRNLLVIEYAPSWAEVSFDNQPIDASIERQVDGLNAKVQFPVLDGIHKVSISADSYKPWQTIIDGSRHKKQTVLCELVFESDPSADECFNAAIPYFQATNNLDGEALLNALNQADYWLKKAAMQDHKMAQEILGSMYFYFNDAMHLGERSVYWLEKAQTPESYATLSYAYEDGDFVEQDYAESMRYAKRALQMGNPGANYMVARFYLDGKGVEQDVKEYLRLLREGTQANDKICQKALGDAYYYGLEGKPNYAEAIKWYNIAQNNGVGDAPASLALCQFYGNGMAQDQQAAFNAWSSMPIDFNEIAQFGLGVCYYEGIVAAQDQEKGLQLLSRAAELGSPDANFYLGNLNEKLGSYALAADYYSKASSLIKDAKKGLERVNKLITQQ